MVRGTTIVRLAVYGCVVVIALLVWQVRAHHRPEAAPSAHEARYGTALTGRTFGAGGTPISATVRRDEIETIALTVRWPCEDVPWDTPVPLTLNNEADGRKFAANKRAQYQIDANGWQAVLDLRMTGELGEDGKSATGTVTTLITWMRNGVPGQACRPRTQRWEAVRP
jgi:hypothetical protein